MHRLSIIASFYRNCTRHPRHFFAPRSNRLGHGVQPYPKTRFHGIPKSAQTKVEDHLHWVPANQCQLAIPKQHWAARFVDSSSILWRSRRRICRSGLWYQANRNGNGRTQPTLVRRNLCRRCTRHSPLHSNSSKRLRENPARSQKGGRRFLHQCLGRTRESKYSQ